MKLSKHIIDDDDIHGVLQDHATEVALIIRLSEVIQSNESKSYLHIAANIANDLLHDHRSTIFFTKQNNMVIATANDSKSLASLDQITYQLRYLFADHAIAYHKNGDENEGFASLLHLNSASHDAPANQNESIASTIDNQTPERPNWQNFRSLLQHYLNRKLDALSWDHLISLQPILLDADYNQSTVMHAIAFNQQALEAELGMTNQQICLDEVQSLLNLRILIKAMELIRSQQADIANKLQMAFYLPLAIETMHSDEFRLFSNSIRQEIKRNMVLAIDIKDIFTATDRYLHLAMELKADGYKIAIEGVDHNIIKLVDRDYLQADFIAMQITERSMIDIASIKRNMQSRIIAVCNDEASKRIAKNNGLSLIWHVAF